MVNVAFIASFLVLAFGGLVISSYLIWEHRKEKPLVCPLNQDCSKVTESEWAHIFYVRNDKLGFLFYTSLIIFMITSLIFTDLSSKIYLIILISEIGAVLFSAFLVYVQAKILKNYCFYCLIASFINLLLFFNSLAFVLS